jgi:hypothetical protein
MEIEKSAFIKSLDRANEANESIPMIKHLINYLEFVFESDKNRFSEVEIKSISDYMIQLPSPLICKSWYIGRVGFEISSKVILVMQHFRDLANYQVVFDRAESEKEYKKVNVYYRKIEELKINLNELV